jgi:hypothetical protein
MKKIIVGLLVSVMLAGSSLALVPEIIGGVRDGLAVGVMADNPIGKNVDLRFGAELNSGKQPIILFGGAKFFMTYFGSSPMYLALAGVAYSGGSNTDVGLGLSLVFNRAFNVAPMFVECGVDFARTGRVQAQLGYKIY